MSECYKYDEMSVSNAKSLANGWYYWPKLRQEQPSEVQKGKFVLFL